MSSKESSNSEPETNNTTFDSGFSNVDETWDLGYDLDTEIIFEEGILDALEAQDSKLRDFAKRKEDIQIIPLSVGLDVLAGCILRKELHYPNIPISYHERKDEFQVVSECGDDIFAFTNQPALQVAEAECSELLFGMTTSGPDTFISKKFGNYTEKWIMMVRDRLDTAQVIMKVKGGDRTTPVLDIPSLRATLPVDPQVKVNVNSLEGKTGLFARSLSHSRGTADELMVMKASLFQDVLLGLGTRSDRFPFLPQALGGLDKPIPMSNVGNVERTIYWFKRGTYGGLIRAIISQTKELVEPLDAEFRENPFLEKVKSTFDGFQASYVEYKRSLPISTSPLPPELAQFMMGRFSVDPRANAALRRLRAARLLVAERDLVLAAEVEAHTVSMVMCEPSLFKELRMEAVRAYRTSVVDGRSFKNLHRVYVTTMTVSHLSRAELEFALRMDLDSTVKVKNFLFGERFYDREALDQIMIKGPSKVSFPLIPGGKRILTLPREEIGIEADDESIAALQELYSWTKGDRTSYPPRELLEDDDIITQMALDYFDKCEGILPLMIIITSDKELCSRINEETQVVVIRLPPGLIMSLEAGLIRSVSYGTMESLSFEEVMKDLMKKLKYNFPESFQPEVLNLSEKVVDTGSWLAEVEKFDSFPFTRPSYAQDSRVEYFEYRNVIPSAVERMQSVYDSWPQQRSFVYDAEGLTMRRGQGGHPGHTSFGEVVRADHAVRKQGFNPINRVASTIRRVSSSSLSSVSKARAKISRIRLYSKERDRSIASLEMKFKEWEDELIEEGGT